MRNLPLLQSSLNSLHNYLMIRSYYKANPILQQYIHKLHNLLKLRQPSPLVTLPKNLQHFFTLLCLQGRFPEIFPFY